MAEAIPIPNVNEPVLRKVIEWCVQHRSDPPSSADEDTDSRKKTTDIDEWDQKFMQVDQEMLFEIILVRFCIPATPHFIYHPLTYHSGCQLLRYQAPARCRMQDGREHDQGEVPRGDPQDFQHPKRFHSRGGRPDPSRERVGRRPLSNHGCRHSE